MNQPLPISIDIELTNRCNATCRFCPRDATPDQGLMAASTFDRALARVLEYRDVCEAAFPGHPLGVTFCGMGEPLLHPRIASCVESVTTAGLSATMSSNGSLLDERTGRQLLDAGLGALFLNVGERDEDYERTYRLPYRRTVDNVVAFHELAAEACGVVVVLVDHRNDPDHIEEMRDHWTSLGISNVLTHDLNNRGGSLDTGHDVDPSWPEVSAAWSSLADRAGTPICTVPFHRLFVGYDGRHHLCSSDWEKRADVGDIFTSSFRDVVAAKARHAATRRPVCETCTLDPTNQLATALRDHASGRASDHDRSRVLVAQAARVALAHDWASRLGATVPHAGPPTPPIRRHPSIPVRSL